MTNFKSELAGGKWRELKVIIWLRRTRKYLFNAKVMQSAFARFRRPFFVSLASPSSQDGFFRCRDLACGVLGSLDEQRKKKINLIAAAPPSQSSHLSPAISGVDF
jgi:hypothetical protein